GNFGGRNILVEEHRLKKVAHELFIDATALEGRLAAIRRRLLDRRSRSAPPLRDDKLIVAWNGLALSAFACGALVLREAPSRCAATRSALAFVVPFRAGRSLPHLLVEGREQGTGFADDHVLLAGALLDVFELTSDPAWLADAIRLMDEVER